MNTAGAVNAAGADERRWGGVRRLRGERTPPERTNVAVAEERRWGERTTAGRTNTAGMDERYRGGRTPPGLTNAPAFYSQLC